MNWNTCANGPSSLTGWQNKKAGKIPAFFIKSSQRASVAI